MGWSFGWSSKKELANKVKCNDFYATGYSVVKAREVGNHVWVALRKPDGSIIVTLTLLQCADGEWGYKSITEGECPYYFDCPLSVLEAATTTNCRSSLEWRDKVRLFHEEKNRRPSYAPNQLWEFEGQQYLLKCKLAPRMGWYCFRMPDKKPFRIKFNHLAAARFIEELPSEVAE